MNTETKKYHSPEVTVIVIESEQMLLTGSGIGGNEELLEDPSDYTDFFE
jgi:hypothetical protein